MRSPLTATFIQSTILNAVSNLLAQIIDQYKHNKSFSLNIFALLQFITYGILIVPVNFSWQKYIEARWPGFPHVPRIGKLLFGRRYRHRHQHSHSVVDFVDSRSSTGRMESKEIVKLEMDTVKDVNTTTITVMARDSDSDGDIDTGTPPTLNITRGKDRHQKTRMEKQGMRNFLIKFLLDLSIAGIVNIILFLVLIGFLKGGSPHKILDDIRNDFWPIMTARLKFRPFVSGLLYAVVPVERRVVFGSACGVIWGVYLSLYAAI